MRWDALFQDLENQLAAADLLSVEQQIAERSRVEQAAVMFLDRLRGQLGMTLRVRTRGGAIFSGVLRHVGAEWLVLETGSGAAMIPAAVVGAVEGIGRGTAAQRDSVVQAKLGLGSVFRALARDRMMVTVQLAADGARVDGTIDRVGRDFLEIASVPVGEHRRAPNVSGVLVVPFSGVEAVLSPL